MTTLGNVPKCNGSIWSTLVVTLCWFTVASVSRRDGQWVAGDSRDGRSSRCWPGEDGRSRARPWGQEEIRRVSIFIFFTSGLLEKLPSIKVFTTAEVQTTHDSSQELDTFCSGPPVTFASIILNCWIYKQIFLLQCWKEQNNNVIIKMCAKHQVSFRLSL